MDSNYEEAVSQAYRTYSDHIYRFLYRHCSNSSLAEDLTHEVFVRAWNHREKFAVADQRAWLYRVARNLLIDYWRKKRDDQLGDHEVIDTHDMSHELDRRLEADMINSHIAALPPSLRTILHLRFVEELSVREVADIMELSEANVRVKQHRALLDLKKRMQK